MTSFRLSCPAAISTGESIRRPIPTLNAPIHSLTAMETARMTIRMGEASTGSGWRIRPAEVFRNSKPTKTMINDTISPAIYSVRP